MKRLLLLPFIILFTFINAQEYWMENGSVTTCSGTFYDSGGPTNPFQNNENLVFTICPDRTTEPNNATILTFDDILAMTRSGADYMNIYDGDDTTAPLIGTYIGGMRPGEENGIRASDLSINPSGCLTIEFISDAVGPGPGWSAQISCGVPCQAITPNVTTIPEMDESGGVTVLEGETVTFTGSAVFSQDDTGATYTWDFGDGTTATGTDTSHTYTDAGTYTVTFTVTDGTGNPDCTKSYTFLVRVIFDNNVPCPSVTGVDFIENSSDVIVNCNYPLEEGGRMRLRADYAPMKETTSYVVQSIPFQPPYPVTDGAGVDITQDDYYGPVVNFPDAQGDIPGYRFCFFGQERDALVVGANGRINFDLSYAGQYDQWGYDETLPTNTTHMLNTINGAYHDIYINPALNGTLPRNGAQFSYGFQGEYPCRMFVVNYNNIPLFGSSCQAGERTTQQIVLWEGSNYIDVYIHNKPSCTWNDGSSLIGLQGANQGQFAVAPGRNTGDWSAQEEAWRFIPDGDEMPVTIQWFDENDILVGQTRNLDIYPTEDTFYTVVVTYDICGQDPVVVSDRIDITFDYDSPEVEDIVVEVCDVDGSGETIWNLPSFTNLVTNGQPDWLIQGYYTNRRAADMGVEAALIESPETFTSGSRTIYVRVEDEANGCHSVFDLTLDFLADLEPEDLIETQCIAPDATEVVYNLNTFNDHFLAGQFYDIYYYENQTDAEDGNDQFLTGTNLTDYAINATTTLWVRIETEEGCYGVAELTLEVNDGPTAYVFDNPIQFCDTGELGVEVVDLTGSEEDILGGAPDVTFVYYENYDDASQNDTDNAIADPTAYSLTPDTTEIYIVILDGNGCYKVLTMPVALLEGLELTPATITLCDVGDDGLEIFDLTQVSDDIIPNSASFTFTHYPTQQDAIDQNNAIANATMFESGATTIWVVVSTADSCEEMTTIELILNAGPEILPASLAICADADGNYIFNLTDADADLLNGQTGINLSYFTTFAGAENNDAADEVADPTQHTSTVDGEVIYVRLEDANGCFAVAELTLNHNDQPVANMPDNIQVCDLFDDGSESIDITIHEDVITGGDTTLTVTYHTTEANAGNGTPLINNPADHSFNTGTTTVYVRVENAEGCFAITQFDVIVDEGLTLTPATLELCDINEDNTEVWDLTLANGEILANNAAFTFAYYLTEQDAIDANANNIANPTSFDSGSTTIYVLVSNDQNCNSITELQLELKDLPAVNTNLEFQVCDPEFDGGYAFTLGDLDDIVVNSTAGLSISYHNSQAGAENDNDVFTQVDANNITTLPFEVFVRVEETGTANACVNYTSVILTSGEQTQVNTNIEPLEACDDGFGTGTFDLTSMADLVTNENTNHWISYHTSEADAQNDRNPINPDNAQLAAGTVYVRVVADGKCPSITQFDVVISPIPLAEILAPTTAFCATDSLVISAQGFNPDLTYEWKDRLGNVLGNGETVQLDGEAGDQSITLTVTDPNTTCSNEATVEFESIAVPVITSLNTTNNSITVVASGDGPFEYSINGIDWQQSPTFDNLAPGMYDVLVRSVVAGCDGVGMSTLVLNVANVITPNGDGLNDYFIVPFMDAFRDEAGNVQKSTFSVYNRYGKLLFQEESSNEKTSFKWDGTSHGRTLPSGDYWYLLELADGRNTTGHITVKNR